MTRVLRTSRNEQTQPVLDGRPPPRLTRATRARPYGGGMARTLVVSVLAVLAAAVLAGPATAREVVLRDGEGRTIRFDVRADVDVTWYAGLLRRAAHADEIERITIRVVDWEELAERCGGRAAGCYGRREGNRGVMVVPAGR